MHTFDIQVSDPVLLIRGLSELGIPLSAVAEHLEGAARSKRGGVFDVSARDIQDKIEHAECLSFAVQDRRVVGFMAIHPSLEMPRTELHLAYVQGVIVHADQRGQDLPLQLLKTALGPHGWPDLVALHTQTPAMAVCVEKWGRGVCFPRAMGTYNVAESLSSDLAEGMARIGRSAGEPGTGVCPGAYPHQLYQGAGRYFPGLGESDALFMVAFTGRRAGRWLRLIGGDA